MEVRVSKHIVLSMCCCLQAPPAAACPEFASQERLGVKKWTTWQRVSWSHRKGGSGGARARLGEGEIGGDAIDADALGDGVKGVAQPLPLGLLARVQHPALHLVEQARPRRIQQHHLQTCAYLPYMKTPLQTEAILCEKEPIHAVVAVQARHH